MAELVLQNVTYRYPNGGRDALSHISCTFGIDIRRASEFFLFSFSTFVMCNQT